MIKNTTPKIIAPEEKQEDKALDFTLRPQKLNEFIGQNKLKENLKILIQAAKQRQEQIDHLLLYGPPGTGKTTLANIISCETNVNIRVTSGPALEKAGDLAAILTNLKDNDILFIDEIHRMNKNIEEVLYPAMEDYSLDIVLGKGPSAKTVRLDLPKFTLIGATTRIGLLSSPLRDRFGAIYHLDFYQDNELEKIVTRSAKILNIKIEELGSQEIAKRSRKTPRIANRLLKRVRDFSQVKSNGIITQEIAKQALDLLEIDSLGLDAVDRKILMTIIQKFNGGPVGIKTISQSTAEEQDTLEEVVEPFLLQLGFINRTAKGRETTNLAYQHLGLTNLKDWSGK
ncbi:MAG: Holliday junction branch migration DNA helicase RuvB [Patescibacteria group bacterium]|nr:Holliday junction branch migration DNA helicase RuvB [Patescibacteria group bacterium]